LRSIVSNAARECRSRRRDDAGCIRRPQQRVPRGSSRVASASGSGRDGGKSARTLARIDAGRHRLPSWCRASRRGSPIPWRDPEDQKQRFDISWDYVPPTQRHGREAFYQRFLPFKGGKKHQPQDAYCLRCIPQVHGAVRDAHAQACRVIDIELNAVTDNPLIFPDAKDAEVIEDQVISAGHFHGMPLALAMSYVKAAIPVLASISERRLNKLVDPGDERRTSGLPDRQ
jgi:hypothetical protein